MDSTTPPTMNAPAEKEPKQKWPLLLRLAVYLFIAVVLAGMFFPTLCSGGGRKKARRINCAGNLKQIGLALVIYGGDDQENQLLPPESHMGRLHTDLYLTNSKVYSCPNAITPNTLAAESNYVYCGAGLSTSDPAASKTIIAYDRPGNHKEWTNFLFLDGHVKGAKVRSDETLDTVCKEQKWILPPHQR